MARFHPGRIQAVEQALAAMEPHSSIEARLAGEWKVSRRTIRRYLTEVHRQWTERANAPGAIEERRARFTESALDLYRKQVAKGHEASAQKTLDMIARWFGIGTPQVATAIGIFSDRGMLTSADAIKQQLVLLEQEQHARAVEIAKGLTPQLSAGTDEDSAALPEEGGNDDDGSIH